MAVNTEGVEAAEAANPGRHLADAAHELGAGVDVHAGAFVRHALALTGGGGGAGHGDAAHPLASRREAEVLRLARALAVRGGGGGRRATEEVEDAGGGHGGEAAEGVARGGTRRRMRRRRKRLIAREQGLPNRSTGPV